MVSVLMYHAVASAPEALLGADPHYAVSEAVFEQHLDLLAACGRPVVDVAGFAELRGDRPAPPAQAVAITFDDGHASNLHAARRLAARGWPATFFVNPTQVGQPGFLNWDELAEMVGLGMSIQSHGHHHRFLDELSPADVRSELGDSKRAIEDRLQRPVTVFAPPGGRLSKGLDLTARQLGYQVVCTSEAGVWRQGRDSALAVPRFAVLAGTSVEQLRRWAHADRGELLRQRARFLILRGAKVLLGNERYVRWRARALGDGGVS